jgi:hypothetical protein
VAILLGTSLGGFVGSLARGKPASTQLGDILAPKGRSEEAERARRLAYEREVETRKARETELRNKRDAVIAADAADRA